MRKTPELKFSEALIQFLSSQGFVMDENQTYTSKDMRRMFPYLLWYIDALEMALRETGFKLKRLEGK